MDCGLHACDASGMHSTGGPLPAAGPSPPQMQVVNADVSNVVSGSRLGCPGQATGRQEHRPRRQTTTSSPAPGRCWCCTGFAAQRPDRAARACSALLCCGVARCRVDGIQETQETVHVAPSWPLLTQPSCPVCCCPSLLCVLCGLTQETQAGLWQAAELQESCSRSQWLWRGRCQEGVCHAEGRQHASHPDKLASCVMHRVIHASQDCWPPTLLRMEVLGCPQDNQTSKMQVWEHQLP